MPVGEWILMAYRLPREPSTPRIALWRRLRQLGAAQVLDGLVALPADSRTPVRREWLADEVLEAGGEATVWRSRPGSAGQERALASVMQADAAADYREVAEQAAAAGSGPAGKRKRTL